MADWSDYYSGQGVDSLARCVALRHHDARVGGSVPGLGSFNTVTFRKGKKERDHLPPTSDALQLHAMRANYQSKGMAARWFS